MAVARPAGCRAGQRSTRGRHHLDRLRGLHRWLLADVYTWAGALRTVNLTEGLTVLALAQHVDARPGGPCRPATGRWLRDLDGTASVPKPAASSTT